MTEETPDPKSYARRLVKGSAIVFAISVFSAPVGLLLRILLARSLSVEEYGLFYAIFALISFFALFRDPGLNSALIKYIPEFSTRKEFSAIKSSMAFVAIFQAIFAFSVATLLFIFSNQIALEFFRTEAAVLPLRILCAWFFVMGFYGIIRSAFQGFQNMSAYAWMDFFWIISVFFVALLFVGFFGWGIKGVASAYLVATLAMIIFGQVYFRKRYSQVFKENVSINKPLAKKLSAFALPIFVGSIGGMVIGYVDTLMIMMFRTIPEVGFYQVAQPISHLLLYFGGALTAVFFPMVSELWARQNNEFLGDALYFLTKFLFIFIIPLALILIAFPEIVIRLFFGENYLAGATALQILSAMAVVYTLYKTFVCAMAGIGKPIINAKIIAVMACINLACNIVLIPLYGIEGAAVTALCTYLIGLFLQICYVKKFVKFTVPTLALIKILIGGILTLSLIFGLKSILTLPAWPEAFVVMIPALLFYGIWILGTKTITRDDFIIVRKIVPILKWLVKIVGRFIKA